MTWFKNLELYDTHRNEWKAKLKKRRQVVKKSYIGNETGDIICAMFVPQSNNGQLLKRIEEAELKLKGEMSWRIKLLEQSGIPLALSFIPKFPLNAGCPKGGKYWHYMWH